MNLRMCYFVFVGIPVDQRAAVEQLSDAGLAVRAAENPSLRGVFPPRHTVFEVTHGGCSCDLYTKRRGERAEEEHRARYRKKGWSQAKIERALASKRKAGRSGERAIYNAFWEGIRDLATAAGEVGLFVHWFTGRVDQEEIARRDEHRLSASDYEADADLYPEDTLVLVWSSSG